MFPIQLTIRTNVDFDCFPNFFKIHKLSKDVVLVEVC